MLTLFQNLAYRKLFCAQIIALFGSGLSTIALALLAYELAAEQAGWALSIALTIKMLSYVFIAPLTRNLLEKVQRKTLLIYLDLSRALLLLWLPFIDTLWQVYLLIFLISTCSALFTPVYQACIPDFLTDKGQYEQALSLSRIAYDLENLLSPAIAGLLLSVLSYHVLFSINALSFLISAAFIISINFPYLKHVKSDDTFWQKLTSGIYIYLHTPRLKALLALNFAISAIGSMQIVNTVVYVRSYLSLDEHYLAIAMMAAGIGSIVAACSITKLLKRIKIRSLMLTSCTLMSFVLLCMSLLPQLLGLLIGWFLLGACLSFAQTPIGSLLKQSSNEEDRAAVFSAHFSLSHLAWMITYPLAGWLVLSIGLSMTFTLLSLLSFGAIVIAFKLWPTHDPDSLIHSHQPQQHSHSHTQDAHHPHSHSHATAHENIDHEHSHSHTALKHEHKFVIDRHHRDWPI